MKFAHIADCHVGSWRDPLLAEVSTRAFQLAMAKIIEEKVDFVVLAGDLFNTSLPAIDKLKMVVSEFRRLKENNIPLYMIAGSHDYSPSGKTMLDVLEEAGLAINVSRGDEIDGRLRLKFTVDKKTGAKLTGILGKMGGLDKNYFHNLMREPLEAEPGYKIFLFHALLTELKRKKMEDIDSHPLSLLPKNFNYYAGGHPHFVFSEKVAGYGVISYTGPLFPNSFSELEELGHGGFFIVENDVVRRVPINLHGVERIDLQVDHMSVEKANHLLKEKIQAVSPAGKIITLRLSGTLESGKPSDINTQEIFEGLRHGGAYAVLRNFSALSSREFEEIKISLEGTDEIEKRLVDESLRDNEVEGFSSRELARQLLHLLNTSKQEGETAYTFEKRLVEEVEKITASQKPSS